MFRSIKNRLLVFFSIFTLISFSIVALNLFQSKLTNSSINLIKNIDNIHIRLLDEFSCFDDFFSIELIDSVYYSTQESSYLVQKDIISKYVKNLLEKKYEIEFENFDIQKETNNISKNLDTLNVLFNEINKNILIRGFKDYGKEGEMRNLIHSAERHKYANIIAILSLRRHEKDYFIRNEQKYVVNLNNLANKYVREIEKDLKIPRVEKESLSRLIVNYQRYFNEIVEINKKLGLKDFSGLRKQFEDEQNQILAEFLNLKEKVNAESKSRLNSYVFSYLAISGGILCFSIILSFFISRILTKRITKLSQYINIYVNSKFKTNGKLNIQQRNDEIGILISNIQILTQNLNIHINNLETIVEERTLQLKKQNNDIISSINYAKNIQEALLPDKKQFEICFPESFIYFKPKSIVSGDFYWFKQFEDKNISVIAVADCTGHGVPGAMMSMLGIAFLNEIVVRESVKTAHEILTELRSQVVGHLNNKQNSIISDGMDISILVFFHNKNIVQFAGAKRDLLLFRNNELSIFQGDKHSIGKSCSEQKSFTNHEIKVKNGDILYLLTDGFQDQLGARSKRTLQKRKAYEFFKEINLYNFNHQLNLIDNYLAYWQKDEPQTDDILIIGLKYSDELFKNNSNKILFEHINESTP